MAEEKKTILFVCTGNTCRSPMAEILFSAMIKDSSYEAASAGLAAFDGDHATTAAILAMGEKGLDLNQHKSRRLTEKMAADAYQIITMTHNHKEHLLLHLPEVGHKTKSFKDIMGEDIDDPFFLDKDVYIRTAEKIQKGLEKLYIELFDETRKNNTEVE